jgi:hypothetical protein
MESLQDVVPGQVISARMFNTLLHQVQKLSNLSVESPMEMTDGPGGPCINLGIEVNPFNVRIDSNYDGQGVYKAYVISPSFGTSNASIDTSSNIKLGATDAGQPDGEEIVVWNAPERDNVTNPTGTNRTHIIPADTIIPCPGGGVFVGPITVAGGSTKRRLLFVDHGGGGGVTLKQTEVDAVKNSPFIDISDATGSDNCLEFKAKTVSGINGAELGIKAGISNGAIMQYISGKWQIDLARAT